jgi:hypothetical protein
VLLRASQSARRFSWHRQDPFHLPRAAPPRPVYPLPGRGGYSNPAILWVMSGMAVHAAGFDPFSCRAGRFLLQPAEAVFVTSGHMIESRIYIRAADELNCHPKLMFGRFGDGRRFRRDELVWVLSSTGRSWHRRSIESAEIFEARVVRDLAEATHCEAMVLVG